MSGRWRTAAGPTLFAVLVAVTASFVAGFAIKSTCVVNAWAPQDLVYRNLCYSDVAPLYFGRGLDEGIVPYWEKPADDRYLEYPVITGAVMAFAGWVVGTDGMPTYRVASFFGVTVLVLFVAALVTAWATWAVRPRGPTAALMFAVSPGLLLTASINWDLIAVAFTALAVLMWRRDRIAWAGVMIGLGAAAKFYPLLLLGPVLVLCLRDRRWRDLLVTGATAAGAWLAVNLPVMLTAYDGWREFYTFSSTRGQDFGSPWYAATLLDWGRVPPERLNVLAGGLFLLLCVGIGLLGLVSRRATFAQLAFLVVAAFLLTNKVYSPQYVLWIVPLAALARPRWPAFLIWQVGEAVYWVAIWRYLLGITSATEQAGALGDTWYAWSIWLHVGLTLGYAVLVVIDVARGRPGGDDPAPAQSSPTTRSGLAVV